MALFFNAQFIFMEISEFLSCRQVLNIMVIFGFMLNYALRVNLTIAIVAMVEEPKASPQAIKTAAITSPTTNDTFLLKPHDQLSSAAHTLDIATTSESFQNSTDKVSTSLQRLFLSI